MTTRQLASASSKRHHNCSNWIKFENRQSVTCDSFVVEPRFSIGGCYFRMQKEDNESERGNIIIADMLLVNKTRNRFEKCNSIFLCALVMRRYFSDSHLLNLMVNWRFFTFQMYVCFNKGTSCNFHKNVQRITRFSYSKKPNIYNSSKFYQKTHWKINAKLCTRTEFHFPIFLATNWIYIPYVPKITAY